MGRNQPEIILYAAMSPRQEVGVAFGKDLSIYDNNVRHLYKQRPIFHKLDETIRGHAFCGFLALVLKKAPEDRVAALGRSGSWPEPRVLIPLDCLLPDGLGLGVLWLDGVIDDDGIATPTVQRAAERGGEAIPPLRCPELSLGVLGLVELSVRDRTSRLARTSPRDQAYADDLLGGIVAEQVGR